jgi:hypothetical protein
MGTLALCYGLIAVVIAPRELRRFQPVPQLAATLSASAAAGDPIGVDGFYGMPGLVFYTGRTIELLPDRAATIQFLSAAGPRYCMLARSDFEAISASLPRPYRILDERTIFSVRMRRLLERSPERATRSFVVIGPQ